MSDDIVVTTVDTLAAESAQAAQSAEIKNENPDIKAEVTPETQPPKEAEAPKQLTVEELQKKFDNDAAKQRRRYEKDLQAEREARIRLEEQLKARAPAEPQKNVGEPKIEDYDDYNKYNLELARWVARQELENTLKEREQKDLQQRAHAAQTQTAEDWGKKVQSVLKEIPDFVEVVSSANVPISAAMSQAIIESEQGPKLAYYLATHPDEAANINSLTPIGAVRALTLIEAGFKAKPVTQTPAPIVPTGAKQTTGVKSLFDLSQSEFEKRRREYRAKH